MLESKIMILYHKDSLNTAILEVVQSIDEKHFPFEKGLLHLFMDTKIQDTSIICIYVDNQK